MKRTIIGVAIACVVLYVYGFLYWGMGPYKTMIWKHTRDDAAAGAALREYFPENGTYLVPGFANDDATMETLSKKGPVALVNMIAVEGSATFDPMMLIKGFFLNLVVIILIAPPAATGRGVPAVVHEPGDVCRLGRADRHRPDRRWGHCLVAHFLDLEALPGVLLVLVLGHHRSDPGPVRHAETSLTGRLAIGPQNLRKCGHDRSLRDHRAQFAPPRRRAHHLLRRAGGDIFRPAGDLELSHWRPNRTPREYRAGSSTEICYRFLDTPRPGSWTVAVNNHVDVDGILSVYVLVHSEHALLNRRTIAEAADMGDFWGWGEPPAQRLFQGITLLMERAACPGQSTKKPSAASPP